MSRRRLPALKLLTIAILGMLPAVSAYAEPQSRGGQGQGDDRAADDARQGGRASLSEAVRRAERDTRGEVLSAERVMNDGRELHRVKVVDDQGRVRVFTRDPQGRDEPARGGRGNRDQPPRPARDDDN